MQARDGVSSNRLHHVTVDCVTRVSSQPQYGIKEIRNGVMAIQIIIMQTAYAHTRKL